MLNSEYQRGLEAAAQECDRIMARITGNSQMAHTQRAIASGAAAAIRGLTPTDCGSSNLPPTAAVGAPKGNSVEDLQSSGGKLGFIAHCLACRAKELVEGMQSRCKRLPDRADFLAAFEDELKKGLTPQDVCPTCGSEAKGVFDSTAPNVNKCCWAKGFHDPWHDEGLSPPDLKNLCMAGSPDGGGYPYCSLPKGHPGNKHIAYDSHDPTSDMLAEWETDHVEDSVEVPHMASPAFKAGQAATRKMLDWEIHELAEPETKKET